MNTEIRFRKAIKKLIIEEIRKYSKLKLENSNKYPSKYMVTGLNNLDVKSLKDMGVQVERKGPGHYISIPNNADENTFYAVKRYLELAKEDDNIEYSEI